MDARILMEWMDYMNQMKPKVSKTINNVMDAIEDLLFILDSSPGWIILIFAILFLLLGLPIIGVSIGSALLYASIQLSKYVKHKKEMDLLDRIDIDRIGLSIMDPNKPLTKQSITNLLGEYVEDCFNRDVLFFNPIENKDFVDSATEKRLLNELLDSATSNISPLVIKKLGLYIGEENVMKIIGRKCLAHITIFVAQHNHILYDGSNTIHIDLDNKK